MSEDTNFLVIMAYMREKRSKVCGYLEKSQKAVVKYVDLAIGDYICGPGVGSEWGSGHIILLILQLKRLYFASNMAVGSNNNCNVILVVGIFEKHLFLER